MATRKINRKAKRQSGGANESLSQGADFASRHMNQHGGALITGAPVGSTGMLPDELRMAARIGGLDESLRATAGMSDLDMVTPQKGGRRTTGKVTRKVKKSKKSKASKSKKSKKSKASKSKKSRKSSKKSKKSRKSISRKSKKSRKSISRKSKKSRKSISRKSRKGKSRRQSGGAFKFEGAEIGASPMLLTPSQAARAGTADFSNPLLR